MNAFLITITCPQNYRILKIVKKSILLCSRLIDFGLGISVSKVASRSKLVRDDNNTMSLMYALVDIFTALQFLIVAFFWKHCTPLQLSQRFI